MSPEPPQSPLLSLPTDIHFSIIDVLDYPSILALQATNRYFRYLLSVSQLSRARKLHIKLLVDAESDDWLDNSRFICYECFQWKPISHFSKKQISKKRSKGHTEVHKRFCIECGIRRKRWQPGQFLRAEGGEIVLCRVCRMLRPTDDECRPRGFCSSCYSDASYIQGSGIDNPGRVDEHGVFG
jgi:hypothetical protein